jgi:hypothetical protein
MSPWYVRKVFAITLATRLLNDIKLTGVRRLRNWQVRDLMRQPQEADSLYSPVYTKSQIMSRLRDWSLSGLILLVALALTLAEGIGVMFVSTCDSLHNIETNIIVLMTVGFMAILLLVILAVAVVAGDDFRCLWRVRHFRHPLLYLRNLMAAVAILATLLGLGIFTRRALDAYRMARSHEDSAEVYRWLQGGGSNLQRVLPPPPGPELWTPKQLEDLRTMERYHRYLSKKYYEVVHRPWLSVSPSPAGTGNGNGKRGRSWERERGRS